MRSWKEHKGGERLNFFFFLKIFLMWTIFKVFIEFVTILLLSYVLVFWLRGMWNLSSPTRDRTRIPCIGRWSLNHWTCQGSPSWPVSLIMFLCCLSHTLLMNPFLISGLITHYGLVPALCPWHTLLLHWLWSLSFVISDLLLWIMPFCDTL